MSDDSTEELIAHLSHANGWWRDTAQQLLVQRADPSGVPALKALATGSDNPKSRLHALWTLSGLVASGVDALDAPTVVTALDDDWWAIRAAALRLSERWLREDDEAVRGAVMELLNDDHWQVRRQLAATLGEMPEERRLAAILDVLRLYAEDTIVVDAALSGLAGMESDLLTTWLEEPDPDPDVAGMLAGAIAKPLDVQATQQLIAMATSPERSNEVRIAMLDGMRQGLEGADGRIRGGAVAGGRAGSRPPGMRPPRAPSIRIDFSEEPTTLTALASGEGIVAEAAADAAAVIWWPGKPREVARPRTEEEDVLFERGSELYAGLCIVCHGEQGQGITNIGAPLAGSEFVTGDPGIPVRVLLHGKEGAVGLMPPVTDFDDEDIAAVVTYIRGSFGNVADPVPVVAAKEYRQAYVHRESPWTDEELSERAR